MELHMDKMYPAMPPDYLDPNLEIAKHGKVLPHWQQGEAYVFVTWRLADAIPKEKMLPLAAYRKTWLQLHPEPWDARTEWEYHETFSKQIDAWLDAGSGSCVLRRTDAREIVVGALQHFEGERYLLESYVVMPNHVHVLFQPNASHGLGDIVRSWKQYTASKINALLGKSGSLWQERYWDRLLRNPAHHCKCREYVRENPAKAKLRDGEFSFWERERG